MTKQEFDAKINEIANRVSELEDSIDTTKREVKSILRDLENLPSLVEEELNETDEE